MSKVWMVTGSSVGLGRAVVEAALAAGHRVIATARKVSTLDDLASQYPEHLLTFTLDVDCRQAWDAAVAAGVTRFGVIDVLVNNAGFGAVGAVENTPIDVLRRLLDTNLIGAVHACHEERPPGVDIRRLDRSIAARRPEYVACQRNRVGHIWGRANSGTKETQQSYGSCQ